MKNSSKNMMDISGVDDRFVCCKQLKDILFELRDPKSCIKMKSDLPSEKMRYAFVCFRICKFPYEPNWF